MATVLDISLLKSFDILFPPIFVFAIIFALLQKTKALTESTAINSLIAVIAAFLVLLSDSALQIINYIVPWFTVMIIFLVLLLLLFQLFGAGEKELLGAVKDKAVIWILLGIGIVIIMAAFGNVLGQSIGPYLDGSNVTSVNGTTGVATGSFEQNITATLFNPKILGIIVLFGIMVFAIFLLTGG